MVTRKWAFRRDAESVSPVIATILLVAVTVVLAAVLYVAVLNIGSPRNINVPVFGTNFGGDVNNFIWTLTAIQGGKEVLKADVYVQLSTQINNISVFIIPTTPLVLASGTHGFNYTSSTTGNFINVGDYFSLSRSYLKGTVLNLVNADASGLYASLRL